jgi:hypothetical protein
MMLAMRWALLALVYCGLGGCGPIAYVNEVTREAADSVEAARSAQADKYAPYYWTRATQYLHKAREDAARADFQGANRFGRLASEAAKKAIEEALITAKTDKHPAAPAKEVAPAKDE